MPPVDSEAQGAGGIFWWQGDEDTAPPGPFHRVVIAAEGRRCTIMQAVRIGPGAEARRHAVEGARRVTVARETRIKL